MSTFVLESGIFPFKVHRKVLDNGFKVIVIPLSNPGLVGYYSVVRTGSRDEYEKGYSGFAHFFEHMMFRGTKTYPGSVYNRIITEMGVDYSAYTTDDLTWFYLLLAREDLEKVMELESDRFQNLDYAEREFKTESGAVYGEYLKSKTSPFFVLREALAETAFDVHTYKHTTIGFEADIKAMPGMYNYSKSFYGRYYRPENVVLLVCGDVDPGHVFQLAEKYYGGWKKGYVKPRVREEPEQKAPRSKTVMFEGRTLPILAVAYKGLRFDPNSKDYVSTNLLGDIMFGATSELYTELMLKQQKTQFVFPMFGINRDPGLNVIAAMVKNKDDIDFVRGEIEKTVKKYQTELIDKEKLDQLKSNLKYSFLMQLTGTKDIAAALPRFIAITGDVEAIDQFYETMETITPGDIRQAAVKYFADKRKTEILLLGGEK
jgi:zinc protease